MTGTRGIALVLVGLVVASPPVAASFHGSLPQDLEGRGLTWSDELGNVSRAEDVDEARLAQARAERVGANLSGYAIDLTDRQGRLVEDYLDSIDEALAAGNLSDARQLAGAAHNAIRDEVLPAFEAWSRNRTALGVGPAQPAGERVRVPIVLANPPPGRIGAVDATVEVQHPVRPVEAGIATGEGASRVDAANGSARIASFDAQSLGGFGGGSAPVETVGHVVADPGNLTVGASFPVELTVNELADGDGETTPAIGIGAAATRPAGDADGSATRWIALGTVAILGVGALLGARRFLEV
jgi:hypothetical protein